MRFKTSRTSVAIRGLCGLLLLTLIACTKKNSENSARIQITMPSVAPSASKALIVSPFADNAVSSGWNSALEPTQSSDFNCYLVFIGGPETELSANKCYSDSAKTNVVASFGPMAGAAPMGTSISAISVASGPARRIYIVGFKANSPVSTYCKDFNANGPDRANLSRPRIIASLTTDLKPGDNNLNIVAKYAESTPFTECSFINSRTDEKIFGTGIDGDLVMSGSNLDSSTYTYSIGGVNRKFSELRRIVEVSADGQTLKVDPAWNASAFQVGDEIIAQVVAANGTGGVGPDSACGANLYRGRYHFAKITALNGTDQIVVNSPLGNPGTYRNAAIGAGALSSSSDFCFIQLARVPHFNNLTISATSLAPPALSLTGSGTPGGLLAFRVNGTLNLSGTITTSGLGFLGGWVTYGQGYGVQGFGTSAYVMNANGGGKGTTSKGGGGGSNSGLGGDGGGASLVGQGGALLSFCLPIPSVCSAFEKMFFGGGGGFAGGSGNGGNGGGGVLIFARNTVGSGIIEANGAVGGNSSDGAGGGAGGSIVLRAQTVGSTFTVSASGGAGGTGTSSGGGGGGGSVDLGYCATSATGSVSSVTASGGAAGSGSLVGAAGAAGRLDNAQKPELCVY